MRSSAAKPLVSVMLPCFNSVATLPLAIASLRAQTLVDWECICVDDGSTDGTWDLLEQAARNDARLRLERFQTNRGRGAARQRILELIQGEYLAFLDSDDWMYPHRLEHEAQWLDRDGKLAVVSVCAAITDLPDRMIGVQRPRVRELPAVRTFDEPRPPELLFPPSMIRASLAKATGFDPAFKRSQDSDFLIRALLGRRFALSERVLYAYSQGSAASLERTLEGYRFRIRAHLRHWRNYPIRVGRTVAETAAKMLVYKAAGALGRDQEMIERRWGPATAAEVADFEVALKRVRQCVA